MKALIATVCAMISTACFAATPAKPLIVLAPGNHVVLNQEVSSQSVSAFLKTFLTLPYNNRIVYISSPGGSVVDGMKLIQVVQDEKVVNKDLKVTCYVDEAASMAFAITQTICDERHGGMTSTLMQHQAAYGVSGTDNQILSRIKMISSILKVLDGLQAKRIGITSEELRKRSADEWWTVGQDAVEANVLDAVTPAVCTKELLNNKREQKFATFFGSGTAIFTRCPLINGPIDIIMDGEQKINPLVKQMFERTPLSERVIRYK